MPDVKKLKYKHPNETIYEYDPEWVKTAYGKSIIKKHGLELVKEDKPKSGKS